MKRWCYDFSNPPREIELTSVLVEEGFCETTVGSLPVEYIFPITCEKFLVELHERVKKNDYDYHVRRANLVSEAMKIRRG